MKSLVSVLILITLGSMAAGCSWSKKNDKDPDPEALVDYRTARELSPLEIPPDLSTQAVNRSMSVPRYQQENISYSEFSGERQRAQEDQLTAAAAMPSTERDSSQAAAEGDMYIVRAGSQRWLVVKQSREQLWGEVRDYLLRSGLALEREDKNAGIMQTSWAENHASGVLRGSEKWLGKWLGSVYTTGTRDQYNVRIEPGRRAGTSEIYLTYRSMIEKVTVDNGVDPVQTLWQPAPPNPDVEAEMLTLLMIDLGYTESQAVSAMSASAAAPDAARIIQGPGGAPLLEVDDAFETAWRRVGVTLDRVSFMVENRDISNSFYLVRYSDPEIGEKKEGFFSKMFSKDDAIADDAMYRIQLTGRGDKTEVAVLNSQGQPAPAKVSKQIITLLYEQLR